MADIAHSCSGGGDRSRVPLLGAEGGGSCIPDRDKLHLVASQAGGVGRGRIRTSGVEYNGEGAAGFIFNMIHNCQRLLLEHRGNDKALEP